MFYNFYDCMRHSLTPLNQFLSYQKILIQMLNESSVGSFLPYNNINQLYAFVNSTERATRYYKKPEWEFSIKNVVSENILSLPFCNLTKFQTNSSKSPILLYAPLSGHYATLLKHTVNELLPYHDVYVTDWVNASEVQVADGIFGLDTYIDYCIEFSKVMPSGYSAIAVCQPTVPVFVAYASLCRRNERQLLPNSIVFMGGPMCLDGNDTEVSALALDKGEEWFKSNVIHAVPYGHKGYGRSVYPGFIQLMSFMAMNLDKHIASQWDIFSERLVDNSSTRRKKEEFYDEYFAVLDLDAEFYLDTIRKVFIERNLENNKFEYRDELYGFSDLTGVRVASIEGSDDDIAKVGQTSDAVYKMTGISDRDKAIHIIEGVGHYGIFSGSKWANEIRPLLTGFIDGCS